TVPYTVFREQVAKGNVSAIYSRGNTIEGRFNTPVTWPTQEDIKQAGKPPLRSPIDRHLLPAPRTSGHFTTELPTFFDRDLESFLIGHSVEISAVPIQQGNAWSTLIYGFGPAL